MYGRSAAMRGVQSGALTVQEASRYERLSIPVPQKRGVRHRPERVRCACTGWADASDAANHRSIDAEFAGFLGPLAESIVSTVSGGAGTPVGGGLLGGAPERAIRELGPVAVKAFLEL